MVWAHRIDALPVAAVAAFLVTWLDFLTGLGKGTGRAWVMHSPWRFWGPPAVAVAMLFVVGWFMWRRSQSGLWARSAIAGVVGFVPAWLFALIPGLFASVLIRALWDLKPYAYGDRGPATWFDRPDKYGVGEAAALTFIVAGPLALALATAMAPALVNILQALLRRQPATQPTPLSTTVSGVSTGATVLVAVAFAALVGPERTSEERARTNVLTQSRRHALIEQDGGANLALLNAARRGSVDDIEALLLSDLSPDVADSSGRTALILAADGCHPDAVMVLVRHHVSVARKDRQGLDALAHAFGTRKGPECDQAIEALSLLGGLPQRDVLCVRLVEAAAGGDTARTDVLVHVARKNHMEDLLAIGYASAVRSGHLDTSKRIAAYGYGPFQPVGSCAGTDPTTTSVR
jgi:hypothetical protein